MPSDNEYSIPSSPVPTEPRTPIHSSSHSCSHSGSASLSPTPSIQCTLSLQQIQQSDQSCKCRVEDMTQFAESTACNVKLKPDSCNKLLTFSKVHKGTPHHRSFWHLSQLDSPEQQITIAAGMFKFLEQQHELQPVDAVYTLTGWQKVCTNISIYCQFIMFRIPVIAAYCHCRDTLTKCHLTSQSLHSFLRMWIERFLY